MLVYYTLFQVATFVWLGNWTPNGIQKENKTLLFQIYYD